jgi:hypothetical protein
MKTLLITITLFVLTGCGNHVQESHLQGSNQIVGSTSASFGRRAEAISRMKGLKAIYLSVRDGDYLGQSGLIETYREMNQNSLRWSEGWKDLEAHFQKDSSDSESLEAIALEKLGTLQSLLIQTSLNHRRLESLSAIALDKLGQPKAIDFDLGGLQKFYLEFQVSNQRLISSIEKLRSEGSSHMAKLQEAHNHLTEAMKIRIRQILVDRQISDLEETMNFVKRLFLSEQVIAPLEQRITSSFLRYQSYYLAGRFFRVRRELRDLQNDCSEIIAQVKNSVASNRYKKEAIGRIQSKCNLAEQFYANLESTEVPKLIAESVQIRAKRIGEICRSDTKSAVNCEMYQLLGAAQYEDIIKLSKEKLQALEQSWDDIEGDRS